VTYPDTAVLAAGRLLERIEAGAEQLSETPTHFEEDAEHRKFRLAAAAGARAYAVVLRHEIEQGRITEFEQGRITELMLDKAELVATSATYAGWLTPSGSAHYREQARKELISSGVFVFHPAVPGRYVACDRLVTPR
jgi:hypothetical protein